MDTIKQFNEPAREQVMSIYESIFQQGEREGKLEEKFAVFRNGLLELALSLESLIVLTGISNQQANDWKALLDKDPEAPYPGVGTEN